MNWKYRYQEIKIGDLVRCIKNDNPISDENTEENIPVGHGAGWKLNTEFKVTEISGDKKTGRILWSNIDSSGVYEDCVEKVL